MHQKAIMVQGQACKWIVQTCLPGELSVEAAGSSAETHVENGVVFAPGQVGPKSIESFIELLTAHRVWDRDVSSVAA